MTKLSANQAVAKAAQNEIVLLDVRDASEIAASGIALGALHIPLALVALHAQEQIASGKPVAVYCAVGGRAGLATQTLISLGYDAHNIGGFSDWVQAGGAVSQ